jgi:hypothetical protein
MSHGLSDLQAVDDMMFLQDISDNMRGDRWDHKRLCWDGHVDQLMHEGKFKTEYRMSLTAHTELVRLLDPILERVEWNSRGSEPIQVEHIIGLGLRVLAGGTLSDNRHVFGMSKPASYPCFNDFIDAINAAPELAIKMPSTVRKWRILWRR